LPLRDVDHPALRIEPAQGQAERPGLDEVAESGGVEDENVARKHAGIAKTKIRNSKFESNSKLEIRKPFHSSFEFRI
jgi:hypothetical protein